MSDTPQTDEAQFGTGRVSVDFARQLERELAAVTEQRDGLKQAVDCANDLLASVTEHRDKEREIYQKSYSAELARSNHYKEQRDRLAEAIRKHKETLPFAPPPCDKKLYEALAAVKGGSDEPQGVDLIFILDLNSAWQEMRDINGNEGIFTQLQG